jgi:hypothetical protein
MITAWQNKLLPVLDETLLNNFLHIHCNVHEYAIFINYLLGNNIFNC